MKNQFKVLVALFSLVILTYSCKDEEVFEIPLDEEAQTHNNETAGHLARTCGMTQKMDKLLSDPTYRQKHEKKLKKVEAVLQNFAYKSACTSPIIIPVAVHFQNATNTNLACLRQLAQTQIDVLNADFAGTNNDISKWDQAASYFPGVSNGEACIRFCIADQNHPAGFGLSNGDPAVTLNKTSGDENNSWRGYMNIFVQTNTGVLGYAPLGGSGNGDGVVIDAMAFGSGNGCGNIAPDEPYNLGRTLTHEVGHYLLLDHIWGDGCNTDDEVADTPDQKSDYYGCPSLTESSCGSRDLHMNYMDYVNDACMYMFSAGQVSRMESYIASSLANLTNNASSKCSEVNGGTSDGGNGGGTDGGTTETCTTPSQATVQNLSSSQVKLTWAAQPGASNYLLRYSKVGSTEWALKHGLSTSQTLTGLSSNTQYQYQLVTKCPSGWTSWSSLYTFTTTGGSTGGGSNCNGEEVTIKVVLDEYGSETSWELVNESGNTVTTGGTYTDYQEGAVKSKTVCLPRACYTLYLDDAYGDGICCDYGNGSLEVINQGSVIAESDGYFGYYDIIDFCVGEAGLRKVDQRKDTKDKSKAKKM